jgi:uncharacterized delta-60 repeat protein
MRRRRAFTAIAGAGLAAAVLAGCTGTPDTTFADKGLEVLPQHGSGSLVPLPNGKIMVASLNGINPNAGVVVVRLNANGSPDPSYGTSGQLAVNAQVSDIDAGGRAYFVDRQLHLTAYTPAGQQDQSFGSVTLPFSGDLPQQPGIAVHGDIYVWDCHFSTDCSVLRYLPTGQQDTGFVYGGSGDNAEVKAIGDDGSAYVSTHTGFAGPTSLQKLTSTGAVDTTFGNSGRLTLPPYVSVQRVVVDTANRITMTVTVTDSKGQNVAPFVLRYTPRGTPELSFGWNGIAGMPGSAGSLGGWLTIDGLGRSVATAWPGYSPAPLRVYRYTSAGALDRSFGINGMSVVSGIRGVAINGAWTVSVATDSANRILIGTSVPPYTKDFDGSTAVLRLTS